MVQEIKTKFHNRFDIYRTNVVTGKTKQVAYAENIVLDQIWSRLVNRQSYFVNIHYGTGTGSLSASRTSLFTHLGTRTATDDVLTKTIPTASWRRKIILNPEDNVGAVLTEIGIAYDATSSHLMTHAMLRDMNGNIVSITKSAVDVLTIYATVYITFSTSDPSLQICGLPDNNPLMNYLVGGANIGNCYFYTGRSTMGTSEFCIGVTADRNVLGTTGAITWTADVANKKMITTTPRFAVGDSNGHIGEVGFGTGPTTPIFRLCLPSSVYTGLDLAGVSVGTGDGSVTDFDLPSNNIRKSSLVVKIDGVITTAYTIKDKKNLISIRDNHLNATNTEGVYVHDFAFSADGKVMAEAWQGSERNHEVETYDYKGPGDWVLRAYPTVPPAGDGFGVSLSADGLVLAVAHTTSPFITTYDWSNGAWVKRADPAVLPTGNGRGCALSADGLVLVVAHAASPYITTYDWSGGAWVKRTDPSVLPTGDGNGCALTSDGLVLAVAHNTSPYVSTYDWTEGAWVKRPSPSILPTGNATRCKFTQNGTILAVSHATSPYISTYDWVGGAWVKRTDPVSLPTGNAAGCALSSDGEFLFVTHLSSWMSAYQWIDNAWVAMPTPTTLAAPYSNYTFYSDYGCAVSPDGSLLLIGVRGGWNGVMFYNYQVGAPTTRIRFDSPPATGAIITADYSVDGLHKTTQRVIDLNATITFGEPI